MPITFRMGRSLRFIASCMLFASPMFLFVALFGGLAQRIAGSAMILFCVLFGYWGRYKAGGTLTLSDQGVSIERFGKTRTIAWTEMKRVHTGSAHAPPGAATLAVAVASDGWRFTLHVATEPKTVELVGSDFYDHARAHKELAAAFTAHDLIRIT